MPRPCRSPAMPCRWGLRMCLFHLIYTVLPCLIHTCHAMPMPCSDHAVLLKATAQHGRLSTAVLCRGLEKNGMFGAWHERGMASVNQTQLHCVNQMGKTHSKSLAARHGRGTAWARHAIGESAFMSSRNVETGSGATLVWCSRSTEVLFPRCKGGQGVKLTTHII